MVTVRDRHPKDDAGRVDIALWLDGLDARGAVRDRARLTAACELAEAASWRAGSWVRSDGILVSSFETGLEMADILADLRVDEDGLVAGILYRAVREERLGLDEVRREFGEVTAGLVEGVLRMAAVSALKLGTVPKSLGDPEDQIENVRKMLVALVDDVRVALIKLAERTCAIRAAKNDPQPRRERIAREVADVYAPLAHRLGIGQLRWELEDLSFRYLEPEAYKRIATLLQERREARQQYVDEVVRALALELDAAGVHASISGRPKHIYSIWRKMRAKGIGFSEVYDVHAVRVLVDELKDCYAALGVVHGLWRHIPHEFDDYIAMPKENGYRSIHTAVIGPEGRNVEVQIRTHEMHAEAELGVCAHWAYKGADAAGDPSYEEKVAWLRQVLEWQEELGDLDGLGDVLRRDFHQDRIYVLTPDGHVVDLAPDATPLDYAYRIHTEVGHHCRAARVGGALVPLNHRLETGDAVEIVTDDAVEPSLAWLAPGMGYVTTSRARAKIQAYFRDRDATAAERDGRAAVTRELVRMGIDGALLAEIAPRLGVPDALALYRAVGRARITQAELLRALDGVVSSTRAGQMQLLPGTADAQPLPDATRVVGAGALPVWIADCCVPRPGDAIVGIVALGHGVSVHRSDCRRVLELEREEDGAVIRLRWGDAPARGVSHDLRIHAYDRPGLLHEISSVFAAEEIDVTATSVRTDRARSTATMELTVEVNGLETLGRLMDRIEAIANIVDVRRVPGAEAVDASFPPA
ncbi:MAG: bifunctional (p)ppGpp synthetase/guanosine-3',5'-bis(diphosphate) 3'-pyrophosphohydrolase [Pseudomonadales bacterium]|jgi:GTP pyrophosphokinase|nr:bifunctional (p)ppGpp synthetase/guanosine-3',5'-bis(diphosphate) 3'-pyrophosphohydrolase [Pseudomonadales bacterium]